MILILLLAAMAVSEDTSVRATCLPVEGDRIAIGDIPGFSGTESIGFAPAPGAQRRFSVGELRRIAERKGIDAATIEPVCFERPLFALTEEQVRAALRESLPQDAALEVIEFSNSKVPKGALEFPKPIHLFDPIKGNYELFSVGVSIILNIMGTLPFSSLAWITQ